MTGEELKRFFKEHLVPSRLYRIGGASNNRICMEHTSDGWEVFFSEQKKKIGVLKYQDETAACLGMKNELRKMMETMYGMTWAEEI